MLFNKKIILTFIFSLMKSFLKEKNVIFFKILVNEPHLYRKKSKLRL